VLCRADLKTFDADLHKSLTSLLESKLSDGPERKQAKEGKSSDVSGAGPAATAKSMSLGGSGSGSSGSGSGPQPMSLGADGEEDVDDDMSLRFEMALGEVGNEVMRELVPGGRWAVFCLALCLVWQRLWTPLALLPVAILVLTLVGSLLRVCVYSKKRVTDGNKHEYVREMARMRMIGSVEKQIKYFTEVRCLLACFLLGLCLTFVAVVCHGCAGLQSADRSAVADGVQRRRAAATRVRTARR
jgi:hypothetical protein